MYEPPSPRSPTMFSLFMAWCVLPDWYLGVPPEGRPEPGYKSCNYFLRPQGHLAPVHVTPPRRSEFCYGLSLAVTGLFGS